MKKIFLLYLLIFLQLHAQDFGYERTSVNDFRSVGASFLLQEFSARRTSTLPDTLQIQFSTPLPCIEYRQMNLSAALGYQTYQLQGKQRSALSVSLQQSNDFLLSGDSHSSALYLPIMFSTNFVRAEGIPGKMRNFEVGSVGLGTGLKYQFITPGFGFQIFGIGTYHYSTAGFGTEYGNQLALQAEAMCILPDILFNGIIFGVHIEKQEWNLNGVQLDYQRISRGLFLGVMF